MKVIIIDDDSTTISFLEHILTKNGFQTARAENGKVALDQIQSIHPDIIISDIMMPELDGFGLFSKLRESEETALIPFIFLSAKDDPKDQLKGLRLGADEYLVKPFKSDDIIGAINRVLEKAKKIKSLKEEVDIGGNLAQIGLSDIIQIIEINEKTGQIVLTSPSRNIIGTVYINEGRVVDAVSGNLEGEEAFYDLMARTEGFFKFYIRETNREEKIRHQNINLLMEASTLNDEAAELQLLVRGMDARLKILKSDIPANITDHISVDIQKRILSLIEHGKTIQEIIDHAGISRIRAAALLANLIQSSVIAETKAPPQKAAVNNASKQQSKLLKGSLVKQLKQMENILFTGMVELKNRLKPAAIHIEQGRIVNAIHGETTGRKALFRIFSEHGGSCKATEQSLNTSKKIDASIEDLIEDASTEIVWRQRLKTDFTNIRVTISNKGLEKIATVRTDPVKCPLIKIVHKNPVMKDIIEGSPLPDLETCQMLDELRKSGILEFENC